MSIKVLIADDYPAMRAALRRFLEDIDDITVVGEAANGQEVVQYCLQLKPDVVTMDVRMPAVDGVEATSQINRLMPQVAVLAVSAEAELWCVHRMFAAGASGYVLKEFVCEDLEAAIRALAGGRAFLGHLVIDKVLAHATGKRNPLARREATVLRELAEGKSHEQIARDLCLTADAVRQTLRSIRHNASTSAVACLVNRHQPE